MFDTTIWVEVDDYLSHVEKLIALSIKRLRLTDDEKELILRADLDEIEKRGVDALMRYEQCYPILKTYPGLLRRAAFVFVMTFLETQLEELCDLVQSADHTTFSVRDLAKQGTDRVALFLERVRGINIKEYRGWQEIDKFRVIRNVFVHSNGGITVSPQQQHRAKDIARKMSSYVQLNADDDRAVLIALPTLAPYAAKIARDFLEQVSHQAGPRSSA